MPSLYLTREYYQAMSVQMKKLPRARFTRYYNDLFALEGLERPSISAYMTEGQYTFVALGNAVLQPAQDIEDFSELDLFVVAYWGHEFDPDGSFGAYFAHHYGIRATSFNVCDQGILSPITALQIVLAYANSGRIKNAALLCFDQRSIPVEDTFSGTLPVKNSARFLLFSTEKRTTSPYKLVQATIGQQQITWADSTALQTIIIKSGSPYCSCAELFSPLFDQTIINRSLSEMCLQVMDTESEEQGSMLFKRIS